MTRSRLVPVLLAAILLVGAANLGAYAATGRPLLLGKGNTASKTTTLKTTGNGAALTLKSKKGKPPLKVSNKTKVKKLNADLVDGFDSKALRTRVLTYPLPVLTNTSSFVRRFVGLPAGLYVASYNVSGTASAGNTKMQCSIGDLAGEGPTFLGANASTFAFTSDTLAVSASGFVDTRAGAYALGCLIIDGNLTTRAPDDYRSAVTFTRVDDLVTGSTSVVLRPADR